MPFLNKLISQVIGSTIGLYISVYLLEGVKIEGGLKVLIFLGIILGFFNFFLKPILKIITLPIRIISLGIFNFIINAFLIFLIVVLFPQLIISGILNLFLTSFIISAVNIIVWFLLK